jgi:transposase-like protein
VTVAPPDPLHTPDMLVELSVVEQRYQAVIAVIRDGVPIVKVAHRFDVSRQAIHRWLRWLAPPQGSPLRPPRYRSRRGTSE